MLNNFLANAKTHITSQKSLCQLMSIYVVYNNSMQSCQITIKASEIGQQCIEKI